MLNSETPWTVAYQASLSMGLSRQEYWNGLLCPPPGDLPDLGIEPTSLSFMLPALADGFFALAPPGKPQESVSCFVFLTLRLYCLTLCDPWTVDQQGPLSMEFSRQEYWSG